MIFIYTISDYINTRRAKKLMVDIFQQGPNNYSDKIKFTDNLDEATHLLVFNNNFNLNIISKFPKENILGLSHEPVEVLRLSKKNCEFINKHIFRYNIGYNVDSKYNSFVNYCGFLFHSPHRSKYFDKTVFEKKRKMSIIFSDKKFLPGHIYRHKLVEKILNSDIDVHIFGRGCTTNTCNVFSNDKRIKGKFKRDEPYENYHFTIAIENTRHESYISEKFTNSIANNTIPIYHGARKIDEYFGENCCYKLSGNVDEDMKLIKSICEDIEKYKLSLEKARYNLFEGKAYLLKFLNDLWVDKNN